MWGNFLGGQSDFCLWKTLEIKELEYAGLRFTTLHMHKL